MTLSSAIRRAAVAVTVDSGPHAVPRHEALHPVHAFFLAATVPLFLGALLSDLAYWSSHQVQWINFASWLIVGGLLLAGVVLVFALSGLLRARHRGGRELVYALLVLAICGLGLINALIHAKDAWASMPAGLVLSAIVAVLVSAAAWMGFSRLRLSSVRAADAP